MFYALLTSQNPGLSQYGNVTGQMVYLEAADQKQLTRSFSPSRDDIDRLKQLVAAVWQHVMRLDFPDTGRYQPGLGGITQFEQDLVDGKI